MEPYFKIIEKEVIPMNKKAENLKTFYIEKTGSEKFFVDILRFLPYTIEKSYIKEDKFHYEIALMDYSCEEYILQEIKRLLN